MIKKILHEELERLEKECGLFSSNLEQYIPVFKSFRNPDYLNRVIMAIDNIRKIRSQLDMHLQLDDTTITSIDFYSILMVPFEADKRQKGVEFYIQEGLGNEPQPVTDSERLKKEFTIHNCFKSMSLVPMQIASNAYKYMLPNQTLKVVLLKTPKRNIITASNLGPRCGNAELGNLTKAGVRGENSNVTAGMGLGLSQVKQVINMHNILLQANCDISQDDKKILIGDTEYSNFTIKISYLKELSDQAVIFSSSEFFDHIPLIILHNMADIVASLLSTTDKLKRNKYKEESQYQYLIDKLRINVNRTQETMKCCLYIFNGYSTKNLLGNLCEINIGSFFMEMAKLLCKTKYPDISKDISGSGRTVVTYSAIFPCIYGLCDLILSKVSDDDIDIMCDEDSITVTCPSIDFDELLYDGELIEEPELESMERIKAKMYRDIFSECNESIETNNKQITINIDDVTD